MALSLRRWPVCATVQPRFEGKIERSLTGLGTIKLRSVALARRIGDGQENAITWGNDLHGDLIRYGRGGAEGSRAEGIFFLDTSEHFWDFEMQLRPIGS